MKKYWLDAKLKVMDLVSYHYTPSMVAKSAFFYVQDVGHYWCDKNYITKREGYRSFLLIYTVSGDGYAKYRDREYELKAGQVLFMDCYDYQEYYTGNTNLWEFKWVHFNGSTSQEYYDLIYDKYGAVINLGDSSNVQRILDEILKMADQSDLSLEIRASMLITQLLTELLLEGVDSNDGYHVKTLDEHVKLALEFVEKNYTTDISLQDMASYSCSSVYHFSRLFKKATGYSPYEYIIKYRVNKAKNLLKNEGISIEEVSECVGFISASNFIRTFKELEGMTPLKYRKYWS